MKRYAIIIAILSLLLLCGCERAGYPYFEYRNSAYNFDSLNRTFDVLTGYILDEGHSYDISVTDEGYDITFHLRRADDAKAD